MLDIERKLTTKCSWKNLYNWHAPPGNQSRTLSPPSVIYLAIKHTDYKEKFHLQSIAGKYTTGIWTVFFKQCQYSNTKAYIAQNLTQMHVPVNHEKQHAEEGLWKVRKGSGRLQGRNQRPQAKQAREYGDHYNSIKMSSLIENTISNCQSNIHKMGSYLDDSMYTVNTKRHSPRDLTRTRDAVINNKNMNNNQNIILKIN